MRVLVVDDDKLNLCIAKDYLHKFFPEYLVLICQNPVLVMKILEKVLNVINVLYEEHKTIDYN